MKKIKSRKRTVIRFFAVVLAAISVVFAQQPAGNQGGASNTQRTARSGRVVDFFEVHGADIKSVLRQLSAHSGVDIVASDDIKANVSIAVSNKSWREILNIICMVHNLAVIEEESFVYVLSREEYQKRAPAGPAPGAGPASAGMPAGIGRGPAPLTREVIPLRFTTTDEMTEAVSSLLSERGRLTPVKHMNALVVLDTEENIDEIKGLIAQIDIQTPQVSISCKIIEVSSGVMQRMGVHWFTGTSDGKFVGGQGNVGVLGEIIDGSSGSMHFAALTAERFTGLLEYLFEDNKAEVVAQPQITTLNNKEARIFMGQQIPINRVDEAGNTVTEMVNAGTQLIVTPYVSGDGKIMLSLNPKKESYFLGTGGTPVINEQSAETNVLVNNGETVVIAGLTSNEQMQTEAGIPILKSIPIIGNLFKRSQKSVDKKDLVIFVTPHIINPGI